MAINTGNGIKANEKPTSDNMSYVYAENDKKEFVRIQKDVLKMILGIPTKLSELNNDKGFVDKMVNDLENYYLKSETYTRDEIDNKLSLVPRFSVKVVSTLPTEDISETTVYLVPSGEDEYSLYTEYINVDGLWEILGTQKYAFSGNASDVIYDDSETNLGANNVQGAIGKLSVSKMDKPTTATVGQMVVVKAVDDNGKPTEFDAVDVPKTESGGITVETDPTVPSWAKQPNKPTYTAGEVGADASGTAQSKVTEHNTSDASHNDIRLLISGLANKLNTLADSDDTTLDQMSEVVAYIKSNKSLIETITTNKVSVSDIIDNLTTSVNNKPLSAKQGVQLKALIDAIVVPTLLSQLGEDSTHRTVTDAEKSAWNAKSNFSGAYEDLTGKPSIPSLTGYATEQYVANYAQPKGNYLTEHQDLSGYAKTKDVPTKTSQLTNDSGFVTDVPTNLPNPNALTFTGAVEGTYDGSQPLRVEIPTGGSVEVNGNEVVSMVSDGTAILHEQAYKFENGLYVLHFDLSIVADVDNSGQVLYCKIGSSGVFADAFRTVGIVTVNNNFTMKWQAITFMVYNGFMYVLGATGVNLSVADNMGTYEKNPKYPVGNVICFYSQSSKTIPSGCSVKLYKIL